MGTITIQVQGDASIGTKSKVYTFADADINRLVAAAKDGFGVMPPVVGTPFSLVDALVFWADQLVAQTKTRVLDYEKQKAVVNIVPLVST